MNLDINIKNIRNITSAQVSLPLNRGMYAIVGENGCGKSTLMLIMSLIVKTSSAHMLTEVDIDNLSTIDITTESGSDHWFYRNGKLTTGKYTYVNKDRKRKKAHSALVVSTHLPGFYEGSIFYGCRFNDYDKIDEFLSQPEYMDNLRVADTFVAETLGYILHNDKEYYSGNLYRIKNRVIAEKNKFKGMPYFIKKGDNFISQFRMSSGECMLISLIDFINNLVIKGNKVAKFLFLIDEVELAMHPSAIDRLALFLDKLIKESSSELVIYFSTHSSELIHHIAARNIYLLENNSGVMEIVNPCYPNYAIRNLYIPNGFDFLLLVEDELAKALVEKTIRENNLAKSKLCCVLPAGGCTQMLKLHHDMVTYNALGVGKHIISIYDGDVEDSISKKADYKTLPKCFLPIPSIEKYLYNKLIVMPDMQFIKLIGDKYFNQRSLKSIINDYKNDYRTRSAADISGKNFYTVLLSNLNRIGISEEHFVKYLCDDIYSYENPQKFVESLKTLMT